MYIERGLLNISEQSKPHLKIKFTSPDYIKQGIEFDRIGRIEWCDSDFDDVNRISDYKHSLNETSEYFLGWGIMYCWIRWSWWNYFCRFYVTKIKLGSNPKEFNLLIDTGSDVPWVVCNSCVTCPQTNEYRVKSSFILLGYYKKLWDFTSIFSSMLSTVILVLWMEISLPIYEKLLVIFFKNLFIK